MKSRCVEIIAHRGSSFLAPENTRAALVLGWRETATCEIDVHAARGGKLVVIHDESTRRTMGVDRLVAEQSLWELQRLDAGSWKDAKWNGEKLISLVDALEAMPAGKRLLIEVKAGPEVVAELARVIRASGKGRRVLIHSFDFGTCVAAREALPGVPVYYLIASKWNRRARKWAPAIGEAVALAREARLHGIGANDTSQLTSASVRKLHAAGLKLNVWTVERVSAAKRLQKIGVDGLITNRPGWLAQKLVQA